jgi:hypothetical protein
MIYIYAVIVLTISLMEEALDIANLYTTTDGLINSLNNTQNYKSIAEAIVNRENLFFRYYFVLAPINQVHF